MFFIVIFFKQKTAYEMRISDWSSDVCSSDLIGAIAVASFFLFPAVMVTFMALLLDVIAQAVERRYYPNLPPARPQPLREALFGNVIFVLVTLILNLLALPFYLVLIWIPPLNLLLFYLLNGYLLGREYFEMVAVRRLDLAGAKRLRRDFRGRVVLAGAVNAFLLHIPLVKLVTTMIDTAFMLQVFEVLRQNHTMYWMPSIS